MNLIRQNVCTYCSSSNRNLNLTAYHDFQSGKRVGCEKES